MTSEAEFIIELWESIKDCVPNSKREDVATGIIQAALNYGIEYADIASIEDEDELLGEVLKNIVDPEVEEIVFDEVDDY